MSTLDINTNGSWRTVVSDLNPVTQDAIKPACIAITNASVKAGCSRKNGVTWRLRDAVGYVFGHLEHSADADGNVTTAWRWK